MNATASVRACFADHPHPEGTAYRCVHCAKELTGLPVLLGRQGFCQKLGEVARTVECDSCNGRVALKVYECSVFGETVLGRKVKGVPGVCDKCRHFVPYDKALSSEARLKKQEPRPDTFRFVSPLGTEKIVEGIGRLKPWEYKSTAVIPHLNTPECLGVLIDLLRLQSEPPFVCIVDTGSPPAVCEQIEQLRSEDVEIHFIRANGYMHSSEPVTVALDVGFARANTPLIFLTHTDCFPKKRDALAFLAAQTNASAPVVGWEMSERSWVTDQWKGMVSHTFTMIHAPTIRKVGATWHMGRAREEMGLPNGYQPSCWPDTETGFSLALRAARVPVKLLGSEINYQRQQTDWWDHARSYTGTQLYCQGTAQGETTQAYYAEALADAKARVLEWRRRR